MSNAKVSNADSPSFVDAAKATIEKLIHAGTTFDSDALDLIYHDDLEVLSIDQSGQLNITNKEGFKGLFAAKKAAGEAPLNTWARYNHISANEHQAHILITRRVNLSGTEQELTLSIDMSYLDQRWQVMREVIFAHAE